MVLQLMRTVEIDAEFAEICLVACTRYIRVEQPPVGTKHVKSESGAHAIVDTGYSNSAMRWIAR
ncbi:hypothetical protein [Burkholderia sp. BCC1998]|uniref:hypothetical protein n=1 Tax=Burkholderia sp. BCC1998 TaxID=2817447 RepID=UPI002AB722FF|nr:hypothetical protein [Burkholderia sp. BCC1998]